jgi:hypothetical protein
MVWRAWWLQVTKTVSECKSCGGTSVEEHCVDFANPQVRQAPLNHLRLG